MPQSEIDRIGLDYDLFACLEYNPQDGFNVNDIAKVLAYEPGEHDGAAYHWVLELKDRRFVYLTGSCDYTGWDCQSGATSEFCPSPEYAAGRAGSFETLNLMEQISAGQKNGTWRDEKDKEFQPKMATPEIVAETIANAPEKLESNPMIYVVMGQTGEYSDNREWAVMAYMDENKAKQHVEGASAFAREAYDRNGRYGGAKKGDNPLDPDMQIDYTGTNYYILPVEIGDWN